MTFQVRPIATVRSSRSELLDDHWDAETTVIELASDVPSDSLIGLDQFSHVEVLFVADRATDVPPGPWARRPRGNETWPVVGIFAQRNKDRPNRVLVSVARVKSVGEREIHVVGLDAVDGTPVIDIKPVFSWTAPRGELRVPKWADEIGEQYFD